MPGSRSYADWFYEWKRSYVLLKETVLSSAHRTVASGSETWREAVERDISDYFMRHFTDQVLQPERREPLVEDGVRNALEHAHASFLQAVSDYDLRLRLFLQEHTTHFDSASLGNGVEVELDWDAQRWKAPLYAAEDRAFDGALGVGLMVASTAGGRTAGRVLAPAMARIVRQNLGRMAARTSAQLASRAGTTAAGATAGSAVPVVGSAVGAAIGFAAGAALDYMGNRVDKWLHRDEFIDQNMQRGHDDREGLAKRVGARVAPDDRRLVRRCRGPAEGTEAQHRLVAWPRHGIPAVFDESAKASRGPRAGDGSTQPEVPLGFENCRSSSRLRRGKTKQITAAAFSENEKSSQQSMPRPDMRRTKNEEASMRETIR